MKDNDYVYANTGEFAMTEDEYNESIVRELKNNWEDCMDDEEKEEYSSFESYVAHEFDSWCASDDVFTTYEDWKLQKELADEWVGEHSDDLY